LARIHPVHLVRTTYARDARRNGNCLLPEVLRKDLRVTAVGFMHEYSALSDVEHPALTLELHIVRHQLGTGRHQSAIVPVQAYRRAPPAGRELVMRRHGLRPGGRVLRTAAERR